VDRGVARGQRKAMQTVNEILQPVNTEQKKENK
jgi:hypothetical protein